MSDEVTVTYLFSRECPSHDEGLDLLREAAAATGVDVRVDAVEVRDDAQAERLRFPGSPTYLVAGGDPFAAEEPAHAFRWDACRAYRAADGRIGPLPAREALEAALLEAAA
ncbi:MAG TPA: hypothetical protein VI300_28555 [Solirubrobacter sp.]|jgi:hypothetical protein